MANLTGPIENWNKPIPLGKEKHYADGTIIFVPGVVDEVNKLFNLYNRTQKQGIIEVKKLQQNLF